MDNAIIVLILLALWTMALAYIAPMYRSLNVMTGKKTADEFPRGKHQGPAWYMRSMDAHANAVENLPLYIALFVAAFASDKLAVLNGIAYAYLAARMGQSIVHVGFTGHWPVMLRFVFWITQLALLAYTAVKLLM